MTQNEMILAHMQTNGGISQIDATYLYGCTRLAGRIYELKAMGHKIRKRTEIGVNRFGAPMHYAIYYLEE